MQHFGAGACTRWDRHPTRCAWRCYQPQTCFCFQTEKRIRLPLRESISQGLLLSPEKEPVSSLLLSIALKFLLPSGKLQLPKAIFKLSHQLFGFSHWKPVIFSLRESNCHCPLYGDGAPLYSPPWTWGELLSNGSELNWNPISIFYGKYFPMPAYSPEMKFISNTIAYTHNFKI